MNRRFIVTNSFDSFTYEVCAKSVTEAAEIAEELFYATVFKLPKKFTLFVNTGKTISFTKTIDVKNYF